MAGMEARRTGPGGNVMAVIRPIFTEEDLETTPDDGKRYEIIEGDWVVSPAPTFTHQSIVFAFANLLFRAQQAGYGRGVTSPVDVVFGPHDVTQPDLIFIRRERLGIIIGDKVRGAPDLIIEVLSPSTRANDLGRKLRLYARAGVPFYWVVDPKRRVVRPFTLTGDGYVEGPALRPGQELSCPLFPGITIDVATLFA
jgi:Uma2 family endonuclease